MEESIIISYCFFTPKSLHTEMRFWDAYNSYDRYWYNIPALMAVNTLIYPDAKIKIHLSDEIKSNPLFEILEKIEKKYDNIELVFLPHSYSDTEPTMWRYKPLFNKESDVVLCRDIDSLPNEDEIKSTYFFLQKNSFYVNTIRSHSNHATPPTIILAGLCGFRPKKIDFLNDINFDMYYNHFCNAQWGTDQSSLINLFIRDPNWTGSHFLDSPISSDIHQVGNPLIRCVSFNQDFYRLNVNIDINKEVLNILNKETKWSGEPINFRGKNLKEFLQIDIPQINKMKEILENCSDDIKNFYLGDV